MTGVKKKKKKKKKVNFLKKLKPLDLVHTLSVSLDQKNDRVMKFNDPPSAEPEYQDVI